MHIISQQHKITHFLNQPYPFYYKGFPALVIALFILLSSFSFNYFFEPFEVNVAEHKMSFFWISIVHAGVSVFVFLLLVWLMRQRPPAIWKVRSELLFIVILLLFIGIGQFLIRDIIYDNPRNWSLRYLTEEIRNAYLVGSLLIALMISLNFNRRYLQKRQDQIVTPPLLKKTVFIATPLKNEAFSLSIEHFLYAKATGNYVEIYLVEQQQTVKLLKRLSLKTLQTFLVAYPFIIQTHRSYLVNLHAIEQYTGNTHGYQLSFRQTNTSIPVSRNNLHQFERQMKKLGLA
ncbi:MAG: LytR/AlgR family response regulator transcription factor [Thermonemataceae bacterium]